MLQSKKVLEFCKSYGFLLDRGMLELFSEMKEEDIERVFQIISLLGIKEKIITLKLLRNHFSALKREFENSLPQNKLENLFGKEVIEDKKTDQKEGYVRILFSPEFPEKKIEVKDFVNHFRSRYEELKKILEMKNLDNLSSLRKLGSSVSNATIIVSVYSKRVTKNGNIVLEVEDLSESVRVLINRNREELFEKAKNVMLDDVVAINVSGRKEMLFANDLVFPDAALPEKRYSEFDEYVAFTSDTHVGSSMFLEENFLRFIRWLNGEEGDEEQRKIAKKVKYLLIVGDVVDGVYHYPDQERFLSEKSSRGQYKKLEELLKLIRKDIKIILSPGQHDAVWVGEPQPRISKRWAEGLYEMENVYLVNNPALIEIDGGFKILMYHGASINPMIDEMPEFRVKYGHTSPTSIVKELLKRRHLAPMHGLVDYVPSMGYDPLVIKTVPDIVATGDQHRPQVSMYNNILLVASSCWQSITPFEEKVGNVPDPCKVPIFNLKTREIKILDFSDNPKDAEAEKNA